MPELPAVRAFKRRNSGVTARPTKTPKPLTPRQFALCEWYAYQDHPSQSDQIAKAEEILQRTVTPEYLRNLQNLIEWKEFSKRLSADILKKARAKIEKNMLRTLDLADKAVEVLHAQFDDEKFGDKEMALKMTPKFVDPIRDRAYPKKDDLAGGNVITIHLTAKQAKSLEIPEGEFEILDAETISDDS